MHSPAPEFLLWRYVGKGCRKEENLNNHLLGWGIRICETIILSSRAIYPRQDDMILYLELMHAWSGEYGCRTNTY